MASPSRFRGIRHSSTWMKVGLSVSDAGNRLLADNTFRRGFACLQRYRLSFDAWLYHPQLPELAQLARAFPVVTIVLDHIGGPLGVGPYKENETRSSSTWRKGIVEFIHLSECGGETRRVWGPLVPGDDWHERAVQPASAELANTMAPYFDFCIEKFGVRRCMFESNFPVDKASYSYVAIWNAFKRISHSYSKPAERKALFHDTAADVYKIAVTGEHKQAG